MAETANLLPKSIEHTYIGHYRRYPGAHLLAIFGMKIYDVGSKIGFMLTIGLAYTAALIGVYCLCRRLLAQMWDGSNRGHDVRYGLLATLIFAFSAAPVSRGAELHAQTAAEALFIFFIFLIIRTNGHSPTRREFVLFITVTAAATFTHNLSPLIMIGTISLLMISQKISSLIDHFTSGTQNAESVPVSVSMVLAIVSIVTIQFWMIIDLIRPQVMRLILIVSINSGGASEVVENANAGTPPSVTIFGITPPGYLGWAAPLLVLIFVTAFVGLIVLEIGIGQLKRVERYSKFKLGWLIFSIILFGGYSVAYAIGGQGPVIRALESVTLLMIPLVAFALSRIQAISLPQPIAICLVILVVSGMVLSGIANPRVAVPNRDEGAFSQHLDSGEAAAVTFGNKYASTVHADRYLEFYSRTVIMNRGEFPESPFVQTLNNRFPADSAAAYRSAIDNESGLALYRDSYNSYYNISRPKIRNTIYTSNGETEIYRSVHNRTIHSS